MKKYCSCCGKQAISEYVKRNHSFLTILEGAKCDCNPNYVICGHCARDLDENGLFPEEREQFLL